MRSTELAGRRFNNLLVISRAANGKDKRSSFGVRLYLGRFTSKREAREAYDFACIALHGDFARPNQEAF